MSLIAKFRLFFLNRAIKKEMRKLKRNVQIFNLSQAKSIGVVYNASTENNYSRAAGLIRHLQAQDKFVKSIGLSPFKVKPAYLPAKLSYDFISLDEMNWFKKPAGKFVDDFINYEFDVLIDLNLSGDDTLRYVTSLSKAKFRIGLYNEEHKDIYDFMLEGIEPGKVSLYIKELLHYLEVFNTK